MKRTRLVAALGLALLAAGCPAEPPKTTPAGSTSLGAPEAGSMPKKGVKPPVAPLPTDTPVAPAPDAAPIPLPPALPPATDTPATPPTTPAPVPEAPTATPATVEPPK